MFEQVTTRLLEGNFVCAASAPEAFRWLDTDQAQQEVSAFLERIGRQLTKTPNAQAYYATWKKIGPAERSEVKKVFSAIKQTIRPLVQFLTLCMEVEKKDSRPISGDRIEYAMMLSAVATNPHLLEVLREFGSISKEFVVSDPSPKGMLDKVLKLMENWGYLIQISREQMSYRFTGKLDYYYQVIDFLMENEGIADQSGDEDNDPEQRKLI
jgi:hypothetical protein